MYRLTRDFTDTQPSLQSPVHRFDSGRRLSLFLLEGGVAPLSGVARLRLAHTSGRIGVTLAAGGR